MALGVTLSTPDSRPLTTTAASATWWRQIKVALGGRAAEQVVFGEISTGAESDIQQLTRIARAMVGRWGMSPAIGPIAVLPADGQSPLLPGVSETSQRTQELIDDEIRRIVDTAHRETTETLLTHRANLDSLVAELLTHETLDQIAAYQAAGMPAAVPPPPIVPIPVPAALPMADDPAGGNGRPPTTT